MKTRFLLRASTSIPEPFLRKAPEECSKHVFGGIRRNNFGWWVDVQTLRSAKKETPREMIVFSGGGTVRIFMGSEFRFARSPRLAVLPAGFAHAAKRLAPMPVLPSIMIMAAFARSFLAVSGGRWRAVAGDAAWMVSGTFAKFFWRFTANSFAGSKTRL